MPKRLWKSPAPENRGRPTHFASPRPHRSSYAATGRGCSTPSGAKWLDLVCGSATTNLGHNHPAHIAAIEEVTATGFIHTGTRLPSPFRAQLYETLSDILPAELSCIQLVNSGAEAIEAAIKVAQFATGRFRLISFEGGYHGRTLGALSITHGARIREPFSVMQDNVDFLPYPYLDDPTGQGKDAAFCLSRLSDRLDQLKRADELPAAVVIEPIQGVGGVVVPPDDFVTGVRELTRDIGVLLISDEIWSGFGRTGRWFSFEHTGITPDIVTMGKAMSGGLPLSAVAAAPEILKAWPPGMHTSTFQGNPVSCNMAVATIQTIKKESLLEQRRRCCRPGVLIRPDAVAISASRPFRADQRRPGRGRTAQNGGHDPTQTSWPACRGWRSSSGS